MSKRIRNRVNGGMILWDQFDKIVYFAKGGNDANTGRNIETPVLTITQALVLTAAETPSAVNRWAIVCLDDGIYAESITLQDYVDIYAPNALLDGEVTAVATGSYSSVKFRAQDIATGEVGFLIQEVDELNVDVDVITCAGTGEWVNVSGIPVVSKVSLKWKDLTTGSSGHGIDIRARATGSVSVDGGRVNVVASASAIFVYSGIVTGSIDYIVGTDNTLGKAVYNNDADAQTTLFVGRMETLGQPIFAQNGTLSIFVGQIIDCTECWYVNNGAELYLSILNPSDADKGVQVGGIFGKLQPEIFIDAQAATYDVTAHTTYMINRGAGVTLTLPADAFEGETIKIVGKTGLWTLAQNANQQVFFGSASTTAGVGGSLAATDAGDCVEMTCIRDGATWYFRVTSSIGNIAIV